MYDVGRKGRDKEKARMRKQDTDEGGEGDWFEKNLQRARGEKRARGEEGAREESGRNGTGSHSRRRSPERDQRQDHGRSDRDKDSKPKSKSKLEISIKGASVKRDLDGSLPAAASLPAKPVDVQIPSESGSRRRHRNRDRDRDRNEDRDSDRSGERIHTEDDFFAGLRDTQLGSRISINGDSKRPHDNDGERSRGGRDRMDEYPPNGNGRRHHHHEHRERSRSQYQGGYGR